MWTTSATESKANDMGNYQDFNTAIDPLYYDATPAQTHTFTYYDAEVSADVTPNELTSTDKVKVSGHAKLDIKEKVSMTQDWCIKVTFSNKDWTIGPITGIVYGQDAEGADIDLTATTEYNDEDWAEKGTVKILKYFNAADFNDTLRLKYAVTPPTVNVDDSASTLIMSVDIFDCETKY